MTSDVDIAYFGDRLTLTDWARLAADIEQIPMAQSVDLLLYDLIRNPTLREHIRQEGIEWYVKPQPTTEHRQELRGSQSRLRNRP